MGICQILLIIIFTLKIAVGLFFDGQETKFSFWGSVLHVAIISGILYYGGFWG